MKYIAAIAFAAITTTAMAEDAPSPSLESMKSEILRCAHRMNNGQSSWGSVDVSTMSIDDVKFCATMTPQFLERELTPPPPVKNAEKHKEEKKAETKAEGICKKGKVWVTKRRWKCRR